jgi:hypothetical protein
MSRRLFRSAQLCAMLAIAFCLLGGAGDYKAGDNEPVKKWTGRDFEGAKVAGMPMLVYFYDPEPKRNEIAKLLESKVLAMAEVKEKLKSFLVLKVKTDGTDYKGWPADWLGHAKNGAAIMLTTSDMVQQIFYDKSTPKETFANINNVVQQMAAVLKYEENKKAIAEKNPAKKDKEAPPPEEKKSLPGLALDKDKDKKDEKKPEKKKTAAPADE